MNIVILSGRVATDIDSRVTKDGRLVSHFNLASPKGFKKNKEGKIPAEFHRINAWGKIAEHCRDYLLKGRQVNVRGHLSTNTYTTKDGKRLNFSEVTADIVEFVDYRKEVSPAQQLTPVAESAAIPVPETTASIGVPALQDMSISAEAYGVEIPF
ncbi:single-stranded DNA-binding protein [Selenomonas sp. AB3002]|uniref:single-stranded DNA-binding protein n=1 Tax=Selenomonas sp. AB3002 TaxID=1392502 RepID=UPI00068E5304